MELIMEIITNNGDNYNLANYPNYQVLRKNFGWIRANWNFKLNHDKSSLEYVIRWWEEEVEIKEGWGDKERIRSYSCSIKIGENYISSLNPIISVVVMYF